MFRALLLLSLAGCDASNSAVPGDLGLANDSDGAISSPDRDLASADPSLGDLAVAPPSCSGKALSSSGGLDFDIKVVTVGGKFTVNGGPANGPYDLQILSAGSAIRASATFPMSGVYSVNLAPGTYDLYSLPKLGRIRSGVVVTSSATVDVVFTTVDVGGKVTANGAALAKDEGTVTFTGSDGTILKLDVQQGGYRGTLLPGTYDIGWLPGASCTGTPCAGGILRKAVAISATGPIDLDLPMVKVSGNISINGAARDIHDGGGPFFALQDGGTAQLTLPNGVVSYSVNLLPGSYDIGWQGKPDACSKSPCNRAVFMPSVSIAATTTLDLPVPMIALSGVVSVNQARLTNSDCGSVTIGGAPVQEDASGDYQINLVPGTYDVGWLNKAHCTNAPWNSGTLIKQKSLTTNTTLDVDIPMVTMSGNTTQNGDSMQNTNGGAFLFASPGAPESGVVVSVFSQYTVNLTPGVYDLFWKSESGCSVSPCNGTRLKANLPITTTRTLDVDVPMITMSGNVTVNGKPLTGVDTYATSIALQSVTGGDPATFEPGEMAYVINLVPGAFTAKFVPNPARCNSNGLPCTEEILIDCK